MREHPQKSLSVHRRRTGPLHTLHSSKQRQKRDGEDIFRNSLFNILSQTAVDIQHADIDRDTCGEIDSDRPVNILIFADIEHLPHRNLVRKTYYIMVGPAVFGLEVCAFRIC